MSDRIQTAMELIAGNFIFSHRLLMAFIGGSELHGAKLQGHDDTDLYGVYVEPPGFVVGLDRNEHFVWSTSGDSVRNQASDTDVTFYSLRKWAGLALKGNPTCLHFMYWTQNGKVFSPFWNDIRERRHLFVSKHSVKQFMGFADAQLKRMVGEKGRGKHGQRPELETKFGYDTKAAMHVIRLLSECLEFISTGGNITFPRPEPERSLLLSIREGSWSEERLIREASGMFQDCKDALEKSPLPNDPKHKDVSCLVTDTYLRYWREEGTL